MKLRPAILMRAQGCEHTLQVLQNSLKYFYHLVYKALKIMRPPEREERGLRVKRVSLATLNVKITVACDMTPCSLVNLCRIFRGTCFLHIQSAAVSSTLKTEAAGPHHTRA